jgi:hypothetical protein
MISVEGSESQAPLVLPRYLAASGAGRLSACGGTVRPRPARLVPVKHRTRHRATGSDRDRRPVRDGCGMSVLSSAQPQRLTEIKARSKLSAECGEKQRILPHFRVRKYPLLRPVLHRAITARSDPVRRSFFAWMSCCCRNGGSNNGGSNRAPAPAGIRLPGRFHDSQGAVQACWTAPEARSSSASVKPRAVRTSRVCAPVRAIRPGGSAPITAPGVPSPNRGAGAGWTTPSTVT